MNSRAITYEVDCGDDLEDVIDRCFKLTELHHRVIQFTFNGVPLLVNSNTNKEVIKAYFNSLFRYY